MKLATLVDQPTAAGLVLEAVGGRLRVTGPHEQYPHNVQALIEHKVPLLEVLELSQRLSNGWEKCEAETDPSRREQLEAFWISLLREYEQIFDQLEADAKERNDT